MYYYYKMMLMKKFLSTPSVRRATELWSEKHKYYMISIHALRAEGDRGDFAMKGYEVFISIHALRAEGDSLSVVRLIAFIGFLSTPSVRRATITGKDETWSMFTFLSTPSVRRATLPGSATPLTTWYFYPRPPCGGRRT